MSTEITCLGEYNGTAIDCRPSDEFVNATAMCQATGKRWAAYWANAGTQEFLSELATEKRCQISDLVIRQHGYAEDQGTWVHRRVAINLGQWCSPRFAVWVSGQIERVMIGKQVAHPEYAEAAFAAIQRLADSIGTGFSRVHNDLGEVRDEVREFKESTDRRLQFIEGSIAGQRKQFSKAAKDAALACIADHYTSRCPQCRTRPVEEFHHWQGKGGNSPKIMAPLCKKCHGDLGRIPALHDSWSSMFSEFQRLASSYFVSVGVIKRDRAKPVDTQFLLTYGDEINAN